MEGVRQRKIDQYHHSSEEIICSKSLEIYDTLPYKNLFLGMVGYVRKFLVQWSNFRIYQFIWHDSCGYER